MKNTNKPLTTYEWLREFEAPIYKPNIPEKKAITWDWLPQDYEAESRFYEKDCWYEAETMKESHVKKEYDWVCRNLDALLEKHGYSREGLHYRVDQANHDTLVFFCHFGVESVLLSHLLNISPMQLWHGMVAAPSSVTTLTSEERRKGWAVFRMQSFGDISHLYMAGLQPSFAARFSECFDDENGRID